MSRIQGPDVPRPHDRNRLNRGDLQNVVGDQPRPGGITRETGERGLTLILLEDSISISNQHFCSFALDRNRAKEHNQSMETAITQDTTTTQEAADYRAQLFFPEDLWARVKAAAALKRVSASEWVAEASRQRLHREPIQG